MKEHTQNPSIINPSFCEYMGSEPQNPINTYKTHFNTPTDNNFDKNKKLKGKSIGSNDSTQNFLKSTKFVSEISGMNHASSAKPKKGPKRRSNSTMDRNLIGFGKVTNFAKTAGSNVLFGEKFSESKSQSSLLGYYTNRTAPKDFYQSTSNAFNNYNSGNSDSKFRNNTNHKIIHNKIQSMNFSKAHNIPNNSLSDNKYSERTGAGIAYRKITNTEKSVSYNKVSGRKLAIPVEVVMPKHKKKAPKVSSVQRGGSTAVEARKNMLYQEKIKQKTSVTKICRDMKQA